jgi:hypothetical protein
MSRVRNALRGALLSLSLIAYTGCAGPGNGQHVLATPDAHARHAQFVTQNTPYCDPDMGCFLIPDCPDCSVAVPILYDAYYLYTYGGGPGGGGAGGGVPTHIPPPLGGTAAGCDGDESLCYFIPGDDTNVLYYSSGQGGVYTVDPAGCQQVGSGFVSTTDGKVCSTWQVYFYNGQYIGQNPNPQPPSLPGVVDAVSMGVSTANSQYPSGGGNQQVLNGGHLYIEYWSNHVPVRVVPLQAGSVNGKIHPANFPQNVIADPHFYFAFLRVQALSFSQTLEFKSSQYEARVPGSAAPTYDPVNLNSNSWIDGLLLSSGVSQGTIDQFVFTLTGASGGTRYPYAYGAGNTLVPLF